MARAILKYNEGIELRKLCYRKIIHAHRTAHQAPPVGYSFAAIVVDKSLSVADAIGAKYIVVRIVHWRSGGATSGTPAADTRRPTGGVRCMPIVAVDIAAAAAA
jgi:hypothetical protein